MYDELVKALHDGAEFLECSTPGIKNSFAKMCHNAADVIEELVGKTDRFRWIPVTERLLEREKKRYWVCTDTGYQCECRWTNNQFGIRESDEWGWNIFDIPQYQKVVAWMSLPDPYEPPKEET